MAKGGGSSRPRFRLLPTVLLTVAIFAVPTVVYAWGRNSASFSIHTITVSGDHLLRGKRALKLLRQEYLGHNLFTVTRGDVLKTLSAIPFVRAASVNRDFPQTLRVTVMEYRPAAYVLSDGQWFLVAEDGHVIGPAKKPAGGAAKGATSASPGASPSASPSASAAAPLPSASVPSTAATSTTATSTTATSTAPISATADGLPAPTGNAAALRARLEAGPAGAAFTLPRLATDAPLRDGGTVADPQIVTALPVIAGLPQELRAGLDVVEVSPERHLTLLFAHGPTVTWGDAKRSQAKTLALRAVLARYAEAHKVCVFVDVSIPDLVLARPVLK
jgi:cell division septal protein FtsQ